MELRLSALTLDLWLAHRWHLASAAGDPEPIYVKGKPRDPGEEPKARQEWAKLKGESGELRSEPFVRGLSRDTRVIMTGGFFGQSWGYLLGVAGETAYVGTVGGDVILLPLADLIVPYVGFED